MVKHRKIMVALGSKDMDLKGVHYALAVAGRMQAEVFILKVNEPADAGSDTKRDWKEEAMLDLVISARQAGLTVSYHVATGLFEDEVLNMIHKEGIDLVVLGEDERILMHALVRLRSRFSSQVIQVKSKDNIDYL